MQFFSRNGRRFSTSLHHWPPPMVNQTAALLTFILTQTAKWQHSVGSTPSSEPPSEFWTRFKFDISDIYHTRFIITVLAYIFSNTIWLWLVYKRGCIKSQCNFLNWIHLAYNSTSVPSPQWWIEDILSLFINREEESRRPRVKAQSRSWRGGSGRMSPTSRTRTPAGSDQASADFW